MITSGHRSSAFVFVFVVLVSVGGVARGGDEPRGGEASGKVRSQASIKLILGSQKPGKLPKELRAWKHKLTKPPFSAFKSFKVVKTIRQALSEDKRMVAVLVGPYVLHLELLDKIERSGRRDRYRFHLKLVAKRSKKKPQVFHSGRMLLDEGGTFFIAGPRYKGDTLILAITLK